MIWLWRKVCVIGSGLQGLWEIGRKTISSFHYFCQIKHLQILVHNSIIDFSIWYQYFIIINRENHMRNLLEIILNQFRKIVSPHFITEQFKLLKFLLNDTFSQNGLTKAIGYLSLHNSHQNQKVKDCLHHFVVGYSQSPSTLINWHSLAFESSVVEGNKKIQPWLRFVTLLKAAEGSKRIRDSSHLKKQGREQPHQK